MESGGAGQLSQAGVSGALGAAGMAHTDVGTGGRAAAGSGASTTVLAGRVAAGGGAGSMASTAGSSGSTGGPGSTSYAPCPPAPETCKILPFGDSITFGIGFAGGYRVELFRKATASGQHITYLGSLSNGPGMVDGQPFPKQNEGHSGWKIAQLEPLIPSPALDPVPHIVLLMIGTNDIAQRDNLSAAPDRLNSLLDKLEGAAPHALIVLAQITPLSNTSSKQSIETYNAAVRDIAHERIGAGEHIKLVDMYTDFPVSELGDGVHPNETGYARMASVWYAAIGGLLPR